MPNDQFIHVRLPEKNLEGYRALGVFLAGKIYRVPADVADSLHKRLERVTPKDTDVVEPHSPALEDSFVQHRAIAKRDADEKAAAEKAAADAKKAESERAAAEKASAAAPAASTNKTEG